MTLTFKEMTLSEANIGDAVAIRAYLKQVYTSERHLITRGDEYVPTIWQQKRWLKNKIDNPLTTILLVKDPALDNKIVGMLDSWTDHRMRICHVTSFAMTVAATHQRQGIGRRLLDYFCEWVARHPILEKIELHVHSDNVAAQNLYEKMGFELEGTRRKAIKYEDGRIVDDHIMALWPRCSFPTLETAFTSELEKI